MPLETQEKPQVEILDKTPELENSPESKPIEKTNKSLQKILLIVFCIISLSIGIFLIINSTSQEEIAKTTSNNFMKSFKNEDFFNMSQLSTMSPTKLISDYVGINIIDYKIKTTSESSIPHKLEIHRSDDNSFDITREIYKIKYPDYTVAQDDEDTFIIKSENKIIQYIVTYDVQYSNILGTTKRNSVILKVDQKEPELKEYIVTDILGIRN